MSEHIHKSHNKSLLLYHFVCPIKYRRNVLSDDVSVTFKKICLEIVERYDFHFFDTKCSDAFSQKNYWSSQEYYCERDFSVVPRSEANALGRKVLDEWVLCQYGWAIRK